MAIPKNKTELLAEIDVAYRKLQTELHRVPEELTRVKSMNGHAKGTTMSVCDLVAYLIGWGDLVLKWHAVRSHGKEPDFPKAGYKWNELGTLAQRFYADYRDRDYRSLLDTYDSTVKNIIRLIERSDNRLLYDSLWYKKYTMGRMIQLNTSSPYKNAYTRIRKWKKEQGITCTNL